MAFTWAESNGFTAIVDFVHSEQGGIDSSLTSSGGDNPLTIGQGLTNSSLYISHVVVYERFLSSSQIQRIGRCTDLVSGEILDLQMRTNRRTRFYLLFHSTTGVLPQV